MTLRPFLDSVCNFSALNLRASAWARSRRYSAGNVYFLSRRYESGLKNVHISKLEELLQLGYKSINLQQKDRCHQTCIKDIFMLKKGPEKKVSVSCLVRDRPASVSVQLRKGLPRTILHQQKQLRSACRPLSFPIGIGVSWGSKTGYMGYLTLSENACFCFGTVQSFFVDIVHANCALQSRCHGACVKNRCTVIFPSWMKSPYHLLTPSIKFCGAECPVSAIWASGIPYIMPLKIIHSINIVSGSLSGVTPIVLLYYNNPIHTVYPF